MTSTIGERCPACGSTDTIRVGGNEYQCPRWRCEPCLNPQDFAKLVVDGCTVFIPESAMLTRTQRLSVVITAPRSLK